VAYEDVALVPSAETLWWKCCDTTKPCVGGTVNAVFAAVLLFTPLPDLPKNQWVAYSLDRFETRVACFVHLPLMTVRKKQAEFEFRFYQARAVRMACMTPSEVNLANTTWMLENRVEQSI
jgi:hypothetical protein